MRLWEFLREKMLENPAQKVCEDTVSMRYDELVVFAERFAGRIRDQPCCAIYCQSELATAMALLACFAAGVTAIPLSARYGEQHCKKILDQISPCSIITDTDSRFTVNKVKDAQYKPPQKRPALIMCTSGTTGEPKGIMLSEQNILVNVQDIVRYFRIAEQDTILIARPLYHCAVLTGEFLTALMKGSKICFFSKPFQPGLLYILMAEKQVTVFCGTPTLLNMMARLKRDNQGDTLRHITISGECMSAETAQNIRAAFPNAAIYHVYGLTEACPRVSFMPPENFDIFPDKVGMPLQSVQVRILDKKGRKVLNGKSGLLWVRGKNVMEGYYDQPELTAKVLQNGWLCTGDIAVLDDNGYLKILGRSDELIIRAGVNIYPQELETALKKDDRTKDVLVYGLRDKKGHVQIGMKISGAYENVAQVREVCREVLPSFQVPSVIELVEELPKNGSGKLVRGKIHA